MQLQVNIKDLSKENEAFRREIITGKYSQVVLMSLPAGEDIGMETHENTDQIIVIVKGEGQAIINESSFTVSKHDLIFVPAGANHNFINTSKEEPLKLYSIYSPAEHQPGTVHKTKEEAMQAEHY